MIIDKRSKIELPRITLPEKILEGVVFRVGDTSGNIHLTLPDSLDQIIGDGRVPVPTYKLIEAMSSAKRNESIWSETIDTFAEIDFFRDVEGILGSKDKRYAVFVQNGGFFIGDTEKIRKAQGNVVAGQQFMRLSKDEVNSALDAINNQDLAALNELVYGKDLSFVGNYAEFLDASASPDFIKGIETTYVVIMPLSDLSFNQYWLKNYKECHSLKIFSGGEDRAKKLIEQARALKYGNLSSSVTATLCNSVSLNTASIIRIGKTEPCDFNKYQLQLEPADLGTGYFVGVKKGDVQKFYNDPTDKILNDATLQLQSVQN